MTTDAPRESANPYAVLQLRPGAPRFLIEETYFLLVAQARGTSALGAIAVERVAELSRAYDAIVRGDATAGRPDRRSAARRKGMWRRERPSPDAVARQDLYAALFLDAQAEPTVVQLAARLIPGNGPARPADQVLRHAAGVLTDPGLRSQYDAARALGGPLEPPAFVAPPTVDRHVDDLQTVDPATSAHDDVAAVQLVSKRPTVFDSARLALRDGLQRIIARSDDLEDDQAMAEAAGRRLLGLRSEGAAAEPCDPSVVFIRDVVGTPDAGRQALAASLLMVSGPREGEEIPVGTADGAQVVLKDGRGTVKLRVWHLSGRWLLHQLDGPPVSVSGQQIESPIVVLEDGDEIHDGSSVLRFQRAG